MSRNTHRESNGRFKRKGGTGNPPTNPKRNEPHAARGEVFSETHRRGGIRVGGGRPKGGDALPGDGD